MIFIDLLFATILIVLLYHLFYIIGDLYQIL